MATDFWVSSHYKRWIVDRTTLRVARQEDLPYVDEPEHLDFLAIYFANVITKLGKKLQLRQRVIATATVFFRRFYLKNSYCETDPFLVISACCYVAAKSEESPVHIKNVVAESRALFSQDNYGVKTFPSDNSKLAEMEFYLVDDLECDLIVYHPYRTLLSLCKKESSKDGSTPGISGEEGEEGEAEEAGELGGSGTGVGIDDEPRYWGTGEGKLVLSGAALQTAWSIINDTYRSELCLLYPPHLIAIAALYLTFILHPPTPEQKQLSSMSNGSISPTAADQPEQQKPRRSSRQASHTAVNTGPNSALSSSTNASTDVKQKSKPAPTKNPDPITFLSQLNVSLPLVATIAQEIISLYTLWDRYKEDVSPDAPPLTGKQKAKDGLSRSSSSSDLGIGKGNGKGKAKAPSLAKKSTSNTTSAGSTAMAVMMGSRVGVGNNLGSGSGMNTTPGEGSVGLPMDTDNDLNSAISGVSEGISGGAGNSIYTSSPPITPAFLSLLLRQMREARLLDLALGGEGELLGLPPATASAAAIAGVGSSGLGGSQGGQGAPFAINKVLERAMSAYG